MQCLRWKSENEPKPLRLKKTEGLYSKGELWEEIPLVLENLFSC